MAANEGGKSEFPIPEEVQAQLVNPKSTLRHDEGIFRADTACAWCETFALVILPISGVELFHAGVFAQEAFAGVPADIREVVISGTHPKCWDVFMRDPVEPGEM